MSKEISGKAKRLRKITPQWMDVEFGEGSKAAKRQPWPKFKRMKEPEYLEVIDPLHLELVKMQAWARETGQKIVLIFEGRDAAGKGGTIKRFVEHMNPRWYRIVALDKPTDRERTQWYLQRYIHHLPAGGEITFWDRSWYNRACVERVMGFCTPEQSIQFMQFIPHFEQSLTQAGVKILKFWFSVTKEEQLRRFNSRREDPLKQWKLSPVDKVSQEKWDEYTKAEEDLWYYTSTEYAPWTVIHAVDKKQMRLQSIKYFLSQFDYPDKNVDLVKYDRDFVRSTDEEMGLE
ncbi:MAG: polyphosphate kinase 2 [Magnetococcales bacterium]|nr:polyphosphate kinase 2 [Magnetococcales bacterium]